MSVQGRDYALQAPTDDHIVLATQRALTYARYDIPAAEPREHPCQTLERSQNAIADANQLEFTPAQIQRDIQELRRLGSLDATARLNATSPELTDIRIGAIETAGRLSEMFPAGSALISSHLHYLACIMRTSNLKH